MPTCASAWKHVTELFNARWAPVGRSRTVDSLRRTFSKMTTSQPTGTGGYSERQKRCRAAQAKIDQANATAMFGGGHFPDAEDDDGPAVLGVPPLPAVDTSVVESVDDIMARVDGVESASTRPVSVAAAEALHANLGGVSSSSSAADPPASAPAPRRGRSHSRASTRATQIQRLVDTEESRSASSNEFMAMMARYLEAQEERAARREEDRVRREAERQERELRREQLQMQRDQLFAGLLRGVDIHNNHTITLNGSRPQPAEEE